jgi:parvulin-like peptidyl-prolyl isomerase
MKSKRSSAAISAVLLASPVLLALTACKPNSSDTTGAKTPEAASASKTESSATPAPGAAAEAPAPNGAPALPAELADLLKGDQKPAAPLPYVVATVEGQDIKKEELEQALTAALARQGIPADQLPAGQKAEGYKSLLNDLITEKLVNKRAATTEVKDEDINAQFEQLRSRFPTPEAFQEQLTKAGQSVEKIREDIRSYLKQQNWVQEQVKDAPKASDAEAEEFYAKNPDQFKKAEQVRASHILIAVAADAKPEQVEEKKKTADAIAVRVKGGEAFDKLAAELSEDPSAKQNSGDLNFFSKEQMVPEFSEAAFKMQKGEISDPVKSQFGFHVIQVTDRKDAETMTLESVKPRLLAFLTQRLRDTQVEKVIKELREKAEVKINLP